MKILYLTPRPLWLDFGGQEVQLLKTQKALEEIGVQVILNDYFNEKQIYGIDLILFFGSDYIYGQITKRLLAREIPYCVSSIFYPMGLEKFAHYILSKIPFSQSNIRRSIINNASFVLPNSQSESILLQFLFGTNLNRIQIIPNAVSEDFVGQHPEMFYKKYLPDLSQSEPFVLSVGRIEKRKNSLILAKACSKLKIPLVFIGKPAPAEKEYANLFGSFILKHPTLIKHISFLPSGGLDLANAYSAAHVHALPSTMETPGLSSLEAGLNGANLVVGDCPPVREYFTNIAEITNPGDENNLITKLSAALSQKRNSRDQSTYIKENYTWAKVAELMISVYQKIIDNYKK